MTHGSKKSEYINHSANKSTKLIVFTEIWNIKAITNLHLRKSKNTREMVSCSIGYWLLIQTTVCLSGILVNMAFGKLCFIWKFFRVTISFYCIFYYISHHYLCFWTKYITLMGKRTGTKIMLCHYICIQWPQNTAVFHPLYEIKVFKFNFQAQWKDKACWRLKISHQPINLKVNY